MACSSCSLLAAVQFAYCSWYVYHVDAVVCCANGSTLYCLCSFSLFATKSVSPSVHSSTYASRNTGPPEMGTEEQVFGGLVPASVVESLKQIGQWGARSQAMDNLQTCIRTAESIPDLHLKDLIGLMASLVRDPNFKISISAMHLLSHIVHRAKTSILKHLSSIITPLIDKLMDSKVVVRQSANLVFRALLEEVGPQAVLPKLTPHTSHFAWRVREELVNVHITAMLIMPPSSFDWPSTAGFLHALLDDARERVRVATLEAFAVLASKVTESRLANILMAIDCSPAVQTCIKERAQTPSLPSLSDEGLVLHVVDLDSLSGNGTSTPCLPRTPTSSYGRLPFGIPTPGSRRGTVEDQPAPPCFEPLETTPPTSATEPPRQPATRPRRRAAEPSYPELQPLSADPLTWSFSAQPQSSPRSSNTLPQQPLLRSITTAAHSSGHLDRQTSQDFDLEQLSLVDMVSSCKVKAKANAAAACNSLHATSSGRITTGAVVTTATPAPKAGKWVPDSRDVRVRHSMGSYAMRHQSNRKSQDDAPGLQPLMSRRQPSASENSKNCSADVSKLEATGSALPLQCSLALETACSCASADMSRFASTPSAVGSTGAACAPENGADRNSTMLLRQSSAQLATGSTLCSAASTASSQEPWLPPVQGMGMRAIGMRDSLQSTASIAAIGGPHTRMGPGGNLMQLQSAPSSDAESALPHSSDSPNSPSKADRLRHLKQVQMQRRAQSAGQPGQPVSDEQLLASPSLMRRSSSAVRPFLAPAGAGPARVDMLSLTRTPSSSISPAVSPTRVPQNLNDVSATAIGASGGGPQSPGAGTAVPGRLCSPAKPSRGADKAAGGSWTLNSTERLPTASSTAASETNSPMQRAGGGAISAAPELNLDDSVPSRNPEGDLESALGTILHSNGANRQELDWVKQNEAIDTMRLLVRHHSSVVQASIKEVLEAMLPCASALRSSTLRNTLCFFQV